MSYLSAVGIGLLTAVLGLVLREAGFRGARLVSVCAAVVIFLLAAEGAEELVDILYKSADSSSLGSQARCIIRLIGVSYVFGISAEICREMGEQAVASAVLTVGRVEIFLIGAPYLKELLELSLRLFGEG